MPRNRIIISAKVSVQDLIAALRPGRRAATTHCISA